MSIKRCRIHPAIGVARVGDSPAGFFVGPERPGVPATPDGGHYKDASGRIKRQAARFRVFGYDETDEVVCELSAAIADITWTVHLANRKAAALSFDQQPPDPRNGLVAGADRERLVIDPGPVEIKGARSRGRGKAKQRLSASVFGVADIPAVDVELGELRTDEAGRLLVLGGHGWAGSPGDQPVTSFADNDGWFDDTSDGPVRALVRLRGTDEEFVADPSWVIVAPPDFAPTIGNVVTLLDVVEQAAAERRGEPTRDDVDFDRDIRPLLQRVVANQWVHESAFRGHRRGDQAPGDTTTVERRGDFSDDALLELLADPRPEAKAIRCRVLDHVRAPWRPEDRADQAALKRATNQANARFMPPLSGDGGRRQDGDPDRWLSVTRLQYRQLQLWADGRFTPPGEAQSEPSADPSPAELDRAALENCVGGAFFPGIEVGRLIREPERYVESPAPGDRYRLAPDGLQPGQLTERMAVPWQADFALCRGFWWPAQRPDSIVTAHDFELVEAGRPIKTRPGPMLDTVAVPRSDWDRGVGDRPSAPWDAELQVRRMRDMVHRWSKLGFVVPRPRDVDDTASAPVWLETERDRWFGLRDRDYFHIMLNRRADDGFDPVARELANWFFDDAERRIDSDPDLDSELHPFTYNETNFETRLGSIYQFLADQVAAYDPADDATFSTHAHVIERIRQFGPLNLTDGVWLRNIGAIEPIPGVTDQLATIWDDENGGRDAQYNHSRIYGKLMERLGIGPAPVETVEYSEDPRLLDSAFTAPLLQLVASEFTADFLPEILGMTLYLEWESIYLKYQLKLFAHHDIDPFFYTLHLAIDNVAEGHGAMAVRAVHTYLARYAGEEQQAQWRRVWRGYVAFRETGTLATDLRAQLLAGLGTPKDRMLEMITRKKPFGNLNHSETRLMRNDFFDDPDGLLSYLENNAELITPGRPEQSGLLKLFAVGGRMYKVFTPKEQELWADWIRSLEPAPQADAPPPARHRPRLTFASPRAAFDADPRGLRGSGGLQ